MIKIIKNKIVKDFFKNFLAAIFTLGVSIAIWIAVGLIVVQISLAYPGDFNYNLVDNIFFASAYIIHILFFTKLYFINKINKNAFLNRTKDGYDRVAELKYYMKTSGKSDIIEYAVYSVPMLVIYLFGVVQAPMIFTHSLRMSSHFLIIPFLSVADIINTLYYQQSLFYNITDIYVISYILSVLFFAAGYIISVAATQNKWHKRRMRK